MSTQPTTPTLDEYHEHEVIDRLHLICCNIDDFLLTHPYVQAHTGLHAAIEDAQAILAEIYQHVGSGHLSRGQQAPAPNEPEHEDLWVEATAVAWKDDTLMARIATRKEQP